MSVGEGWGTKGLRMRGQESGEDRVGNDGERLAGSGRRWRQHGCQHPREGKPRLDVETAEVGSGEEGAGGTGLVGAKVDGYGDGKGAGCAHRWLVHCRWRKGGTRVVVGLVHCCWRKVENLELRGTKSSSCYDCIHVGAGTSLEHFYVKKKKINFHFYYS